MNTKVKKHKQIMHDPFIIPRVKQYLEENVHQTYVDVAVMARQLQDRYREYSRRKVGPFRTLVEQAYRTVLHSYGLDSNPSSDENDGSDVEMMEGDNANTNHLNNALTQLYSKNTQKPDNELIDISSDESGNEGEKSRGKTIEPEVTISKANDNNQHALKSLVAKMSRNGTKIVETQQNSAVIASFGPQGATIHTSKKRRIDNGQSPVRIGEKTPPTASASGPAGDGPVPTNPLNPAAMRLRKYKKEVKPKKATVNFHDLGGLDRVLRQLCELLFHMKHPEVYNHIGVKPPQGILLHGPPGCGKTLLANAIAGQLELPLIEVPATELIGGVSGESEERIRDIFEQAGNCAPCILFIDEIDAISSNRINAQRDMERRIVAQLMSSLDALSKLESGKHVLVLGATNRPEALDPALRRVGRFDHEISLGIPDRDEREEILITICMNLCVENPMDYGTIAELTPGYVGADLEQLTSRAASMAIKRAFANIYEKREEDPAKEHGVVDLDEDAEETKEPEKEIDPRTEAIPEGAADDVAALDDNENADVTIVAENEAEKPTTKDPSKPTEEDANEDSIQMVEDEEPEKEKTEVEVAKPAEEAAEVIKVNGEDDVIAVDEDAEELVEADTTEKETEVEAMEVAPENEAAATDDKEAPTEVEEPSAAVEEEGEGAIDLDELPDEPPQSEDKVKAKEISLFDMLHWIEHNTQTLLDSQLDEICVTLEDFKEAIKVTVPSAKREGFITVPDVTWDDIGSLRDIREELRLSVLAPVKFPDKLKALGITTPSGVLLCGPPGCGKTLIAKAIANEAGINFISVKGPELMNMYVGESERAVRQCFQRARNSQPCVIFFDEFDSLCPKRSDAADGGSATRVVNQLLTEMDGVEDRKGVFLMAASNRPDIIDPAVLRPGRLDTILYVGLPNKEDRKAILEALTKKGKVPALAQDVDIDEIADQTEGFTGADLAGLIRQASLLKLKESISACEDKTEELFVQNKHFLQALTLTKPSVSEEDKRVYERLKQKYAAPRATQTEA